MYRRDFFKTMIVTPFLSPFLLASKSSAYDELFLISDKPQIILPSLLDNLGRLKSISGRKFSFSCDHPQKRALIQVFKRNGWAHVPPSSQSSMSLSFHPLQRLTPASFTLVRSGQILDIRSHGLRSLWQEMNSNHASSVCLTIASLRTGAASLTAGESVRIYKDGRRADDLSLNKDRVLSFQAKKGSIIVKIQRGKVWVPESSCRHRICCLTSPISITGERIVCAPNHFLVEIRGPRMVDTVIG